ncbi:MAG: indole-3-glycerol-phosphate synthase [Acidobacteriota bacterium]
MEEERGEPRILRPQDPWARNVAIQDLTPFLIAEVKRASPSRGAIAPEADAAERARRYEAGGAAAVSVLCEPERFGGSREDVRAAAAAVSVPVLCKDFVVDPVQLRWAREDGARWVLLIARVLGNDLRAFVQEALALGLEPLVEAHSEGEMEAALSTDARLVGVNARDLDTLAVDLSVVERLAPLCPPDRVCVAESGIRRPEDVRRLREAGARGFLVGESLMREERPERLLARFRSALGLNASEEWA